MKWRVFIFVLTIGFSSAAFADRYGVEESAMDSGAPSGDMGGVLLALLGAALGRWIGRKVGALFDDFYPEDASHIAQVGGWVGAVIGFFAIPLLNWATK